MLTPKALLLLNLKLRKQIYYAKRIVFHIFLFAIINLHVVNSQAPLRCGWLTMHEQSDMTRLNFQLLL